MKIGVFLCTCGDTLNNTLENSELQTFAQTLPKVAHVETRTDYCQQQALQALVQTIKEKKLDRIVMAGCSPQLHGYPFEKAAADAGLSAGQIAYANIREHCAWVHLKEPKHATAKAKRLIRAAVNRAAKQQPIPTKQFPVSQEVLVIGGGIAGIQSALDLANQGTKVHLVERTPTIGGVMAVLVKTFPSDDCAICLPGSEDVILDNGSFTPIGSLAENLGAEHDIEFPEYPRTFSYETGLIKVNEVIAGQKLLSPSNLVEIMTSTGARVRCTPNHKVLVDRSEGSVWVRADQLKIGDRVYSPRKLDLQQTSEYWIVDLIPDDFKAVGVNPSRFRERLRMRFGNLKRAAHKLELDYRKLFDGKWLSLGELKRIYEALQLSWIELRGQVSTLTYRGSHNVPLGTQILNKEFLYLLGLLASDGTIEKDRIRFTNTDRELINLFVKIYQTLFPSKAAHISKITSKKATQKHRYVVQVKNQVLYHICNHLDVKGNLKSIFQFEDKLIAAFLGGFFDGDGSVTKIQKDKQLSGKITLHPGQDYMRGFGLHLLLKRLGIISKVYDYESRVIVDVSGKHEIFLFLSKINSYHSQRSRQLKDLEASIIHHGIKRVGLFDQVPLVAGRHLQRVKQRYRILLKSFPLSHSNTLRILRQECRMTKTTLLRILPIIKSIVEEDDADLAKLQHLTKSPFFLDKIKNFRMVPSDDHYVYDITVQNSHNFIPNGAFVVSNCIEGPKMADVSMHPNITLHCYSEVEEVTPVGKDFEVRVQKKPTYVDWDKCTGCMSCTEKCPTRVTDEWTWGLGKRRAIFMPFSQSVPR
ncbi:MAG: LAGLIDADG family homing endonuclease, partial [Candidatus Hermodarchaeota archaeon]